MPYRIPGAALRGVLLLFCIGAATASASESHARLVLPDSVQPERYRIDFTPDPAALTFSGQVEIDLRVRESVDRIVLNAADLVIDRAELAGQDEPPQVSYDAKLGRVALALHRAIKPGPYTLKLAYHGVIYRQSSGLFALDYATANGSARALFTQFENVDARRFVPCWDEPARKATFELSATIPAGQMAVSNMPIASSEPLPGNLQHVRFAITPRMSPYLLFFAAGDFERRTREVDGVEVGVVAKRGELDKADFVLDSAVDILHYYNDYFGIRYPLPKLDLIAGPGSSANFSAMENWGAIFSFESAMLIDTRIASERDRQRAYLVAAHEMAHQWFGDLVTMQWWDDLWLNEGFASWMDDKVTDHFHPEWHVWLQSLGSRQRAMALDARSGTHPVIPHILDANEAVADFDEIAYQKGEATIRTLESYLGEDAFRSGVRRYMHDRAYGNAVTDDLWRAMDRDSSMPITQIAHDLTRQAGVPLIRERSVECRADSTVLGLSQGRFAVDPDSTTARIWHVPVRAATLGAPAAHAIVAGTVPTSLQLSGCSTAIINVGQTAYFRTLYLPSSLAALTERYAQLPAADQLGLLYDAQSFAYHGEQTMAALMALAAALPADAAPEVSVAWAGTLDGLDELSEGLPLQPPLRAFSRAVLNRLFVPLGWDPAPGEPTNVALAREAVIAALSHLDDEAVIAEGRRRFARFLTDPGSFDAAARHLTLETAAAHADATTWSQLHELARNARSELERLQYYRLLTRAEDETLVRKALELTLTGEPPRTLLPEIFRRAAERHSRLAFEFARTHWTQLSPSIEPDSRIRFVPRLLGNASDDALIAPLQAFAEANIPTDRRSDVTRAEASVRYLARVRRERLPDLARWLQQRGSPGIAQR
jgi:aminopeptidase N